MSSQELNHLSRTELKIEARRFGFEATDDDADDDIKTVILDRQRKTSL